MVNSAEFIARQDALRRSQRFWSIFHKLLIGIAVVAAVVLYAAYRQQRDEIVAPDVASWNGGIDGHVVDRSC